MRSTTLWARLLGLAKAVVENVEFDEADEALPTAPRAELTTRTRSTGDQQAGGGALDTQRHGGGLHQRRGDQ